MKRGVGRAAAHRISGRIYLTGAPDPAELDGGYNRNSFSSIANERPDPGALQRFSATTRD
jgi:hypothetical protein